MDDRIRECERAYRASPYDEAARLAWRRAMHRGGERHFEVGDLVRVPSVLYPRGYYEATVKHTVDWRAIYAEETAGHAMFAEITGTAMRLRGAALPRDPSRNPRACFHGPDGAGEHPWELVEPCRERTTRWTTLREPREVDGKLVVRVELPVPDSRTSDWSALQREAPQNEENGDMTAAEATRAAIQAARDAEARTCDLCHVVPGSISEGDVWLCADCHREEAQRGVPELP